MFSGSFKKWSPTLLFLVLIAIIVSVSLWAQTQRAKVLQQIADQVTSDEQASALTLSSPIPTEAAELPEKQASSEALRRGTINKSEVNIRSAPSLKSTILKQANTGDSFVFSSAQTEAEGLTWLELNLEENQTGWVSADFVVLEPASPVRSAAETQSLPTHGLSTPLVELHLQSASVWEQATDKQRLLSAAAMLEKIFKDKPEEITQQNLLLLTACIDNSAREKDLKQLKIYELASACSMAMNWR